MTANKRMARMIRSLKKNRSRFMKIAGMSTLLYSPILSAKMTIKAVRATDKRKEELGVDKLTTQELIATNWKYYIPVVGSMATGLGLSIGGEKIDIKEKTALSAALIANNANFETYKQKVIERIGENKEREIEGEVVKEQIKNAPAETSKYIAPGEGGTLFFEPCTGRAFYSTPEKVRKAYNRLTSMMHSSYYVDLNDFFSCLGLPDIDMGDVIGWNNDAVRSIELDRDRFIPCMVDEIEEPCLRLTYNFWPNPNYKNK